MRHPKRYQTESCQSGNAMNQQPANHYILYWNFAEMQVTPHAFRADGQSLNHTLRTVVSARLIDDLSDEDVQHAAALLSQASSVAEAMLVASDKCVEIIPDHLARGRTGYLVEQ